jgi:hypothetical protein
MPENEPAKGVVPISWRVGNQVLLTFVTFLFDSIHGISAVTHIPYNE